MRSDPAHWKDIIFPKQACCIMSRSFSLPLSPKNSPSSLASPSSKNTIWYSPRRTSNLYTGPPPVQQPQALLASISFKSPESEITVSIPPHNWKFTKNSSMLPVYHPTGPMTAIWNISTKLNVLAVLPEQQAMEEFIQETFQQGYICPSTSPASEEFFLCRRKGRASDRVLTDLNCTPWPISAGY